MTSCKIPQKKPVQIWVENKNSNQSTVQPDSACNRDIKRAKMMLQPSLSNTIQKKEVRTFSSPSCLSHSSVWDTRIVVVLSRCVPYLLSVVVTTVARDHQNRIAFELVLHPGFSYPTSMSPCDGSEHHTFHSPITWLQGIIAVVLFSER